MKPIEPLTLTDLQRATGGAESMLSRFGNWVANTIGYAGPAGASDAASAIQPVAGVMAIAPQARNRNELIKDLAQNGGNYKQENFERYNNGDAAKLARKVGTW